MTPVHVPTWDSVHELGDALTTAGLLVPTSVPGVVHRSGTFEDVVRAVEAYAAAQRERPALRHAFPPVLPRADFERTDYLRSFPHLLGSVDIFDGDDRSHRRLLGSLDAGEEWTAGLTPAPVVLSSSVCHSLYGVLPADLPTEAGGEGWLHECTGWSFRHEPSDDPARMQAFRMYEFVLLGAADAVLDHRDRWLRRGAEALARLGLQVETVVAHDPFFGRVGSMLAGSQVEAALKSEVVVELVPGRETAIASSNCHEDHFGDTFGLRLPDGSVAHSACFGFGLERIALALFARHGLDVDGWPDDVRAELW